MPDRQEIIPHSYAAAESARTYWAGQYDWAVGQTAIGTAALCSALWLILDGVVEVTLLPEKGGEVSRHAHPGDALLLPPHVRRNIATPNGARWLSVGLELIPSPPTREHTLRLWHPQREYAVIMRQWMTQATGEWRPPDAAADRTGWSLREGDISRRISDGLAIALWGLCQRVGQADTCESALAAGPPVPQWFVSILEQVAQNPGVPLSDLARTVFVSTSHLRRAFHTWAGMSPQEYRTQCRLNAARTLLTETDRTVAYVAAAVGFDGPFYFSRLFKRRFGVSPARFREIARSPVF